LISFLRVGKKHLPEKRVKHLGKAHYTQQIFSFILSLCFFFILFCPNDACSQKTKIYYFNPDCGANMLQLSKTFNEIAVENAHGQFSLVPLPNMASLKNDYRSGPLIVSSQYLVNDLAKPQMSSLLQASRNDKFYHNKILIGRKGLIEKNGITGKTISITSLSMQTEEYVLEILFRGYKGQTNKTHLLSVPRDSDALLALVFNQVDGAFIEPETMNLLDQINPTIKEELHIFHTSGYLTLPEVFVDHEDCDTHCQHNLEDFFLEQSTNPEGIDLLRKMCIDRWHKTGDPAKW